MIGLLGPDDAKCNKEGIEWFPTGTARWQRYAPNFFIAGAPKAGTTSLSCLLKQHHNVFEPLDKELNLFRNLPIEANKTIHVKTARRFLRESGGYEIGSLTKHAHALSYDATPSYLFYSSTIMPQIFCVCPWVKVILRDPIERLVSSYNYEFDRGRIPQNKSFDSLVEEEF